MGRGSRPYPRAIAPAMPRKRRRGQVAGDGDAILAAGRTPPPVPFGGLLPPATLLTIVKVTRTKMTKIVMLSLGLPTVVAAARGGERCHVSGPPRARWWRG